MFQQNSLCIDLAETYAPQCHNLDGCPSLVFAPYKKTELCGNGILVYKRPQSYLSVVKEFREVGVFVECVCVCVCVWRQRGGRVCTKIIRTKTMTIKV